MGVLRYGLWLHPSFPRWGLWCARLGLGFGLHPAIPGWGFWGVRGCVRTLPVPQHSWLGCAVWSCVLRSGCGCAPPLLAGVLRGVRVCVRAPSVPRDSWLVCAVCMCVPGLGLWLRPATPGWGVWGVFASVCALRLYPATPGRGVRCGCVCLGSGFVCAPPVLGGELGCVCVCVCTRPVPRVSWLGCAVWVGVLWLRFRLCPATAGWGFWGVCVFVCAFCLVPCPSWLGCAVCVCVLGLGFPLRPATPGWGVGVCVCSCVCPACTSPLLAGWCVCVWVWLSSALRFFLAWMLGRVASCLRRVRFSSPPGGAACGVGVCGSCRGWGLSPTLSFCFFFRVVGGGGWFSGLSRLGFVVSDAACPAWVPSPVPFGWGVCPPLVVWLGGFRAVCLSHAPRPFFFVPLTFFFWGGGLPVPPSAFPGLVHALVGIRCGEPGCCWCWPLAGPCPGPMGRVRCVHAWPGGLSCRVRFWLCRLGGCVRRFRGALV